MAHSDPFYFLGPFVFSTRYEKTAQVALFFQVSTQRGGLTDPYWKLRDKTLPFSTSSFPAVQPRTPRRPDMARPDRHRAKGVSP